MSSGVGSHMKMSVHGRIAKCKYSCGVLKEFFLPYTGQSFRYPIPKRVSLPVVLDVLNEYLDSASGDFRALAVMQHSLK